MQASSWDSRSGLSLAPEARVLYTPHVAVKKSKIAKSTKFNKARQTDEAGAKGTLVVRLGDVNDPESIQRFRKAAADFTLRAVRSK
jgi:hypothetical protein